MHLNVIKKKKKGALQHDVTEGSITARCREKAVPQDGSKNMCILLFQRLNKGILNRADGGGGIEGILKLPALTISQVL